LDLDSFPQFWFDLGIKEGLCLKQWQMRRGVSRQEARDTLSDLVRVTPSLPLTLEEAEEVTRKELGFPATALPKWEGVDDLANLGFVSLTGNRYDAVLSPTENAILKIIEYQEIDPRSYTNTFEAMAEQICSLFWNFTANPKINELTDYIKLLDEKGLLIRRAEAETKQRVLDFKRLYAEAGQEDEYKSSIKKYCDTLSRSRRKRTLEGINRSFAYLHKNYQELLESAVRSQEIQRRDYCASALFAIHSDLSELYQEGSSHYQAVKKKLNEAAIQKRFNSR
jgi:hypothetical protein